jgi:hypothetical protein
MKFRLVWEPCHDCGRRGEIPGGCIVVERRTLLGWSAALTTFDRGGVEFAEHFPTTAAALTAWRASLAPQAQRIVLRELGEE